MTTTKTKPTKKTAKAVPSRARKAPARKAPVKRVTNGVSTRPLTAEYFQTKRGLWTWRLKSGNQVNWAGPSEGFSQKSNAERSLRDLVTRLGGKMTNVVEVFLDATPTDL